MHPAKQELRDLILSKLSAGQTPEQAADAVLELFYEVADDRQQFDISTYADRPGSRVLNQRTLVARIPRESVEQVEPAPDRSVA